MRLESHSEAETGRLAGCLARHLEPGDVIGLEGPLGSGKTRFVEGLARGLEARARVRSPTFTLVNEYSGRIPLVHCDLYRLQPGEVRDLALDEALERGVLAVEWADTLPESYHAEALEIRFASGGGDARVLEVDGRGARGAALLVAWRGSIAAAGVHS